MINQQQIFRVFKNYRFLKQGTNHILIQHNDKYQFFIFICQDDDYASLNENHLKKRKNCVINNASSPYFYMYLPESLIINKLRQINLNYLLND